MPTDILVVEDEPAIAESVAYALRRDGFGARVAGSVNQALVQIQGARLVVLDLMLPDGSGFDLIRRWREARQPTPIIVLSSRDDEADRVQALEAGADDYVTKPFSPREVVARVRAVLRRVTERQQLEASSLSPLAIDATTRQATALGRQLELTRVEFDLLSCLLKQPGRVYSRTALIDLVWGTGFKVGDRTIDSHIKSLRRKVAEVGCDPAAIETVRGVGYRISIPDADGAEVHRTPNRAPTGKSNADSS